MKTGYFRLADGENTVSAKIPKVAKSPVFKPFSGINIPQFYWGKKKALARIRRRAKSKPKILKKKKPPSIISKGLATALPKEYEEELTNE